MEDQKLTDWFPPEVKPVHAGFYDTKIFSIYRNYWNGKEWCYEHSPKWACLVQRRPWRGLAEKPVAK